MPPLAQHAHVDAEEFLGEWHPLVRQLGSSEGLLSLGSTSKELKLPRVRDRKSLRHFLECYKSEVLIPFELPAILRAYLHSTRNETRELIAYDQELAEEAALKPFQRASWRMGQFQLTQLRPLRDHRLLQRFIRAVEEKRAHGWHTLVLGMTLAIYSLPVRQGLTFYERQTLRGFLYAASRKLSLSVHECRVILNDLCSDVPHRVDTLTPTREWVLTSS